MPDRYILWDFDGTLGFREGMWSGALAETVSRFEPAVICEMAQFRPHLQSGFPWHAPERGHDHIVSAEAWWQALFPLFARAIESAGVSPARSAELAREVPSIYLDPTRWKVFEDVPTALETLQKASWKHAILSNHVPELSGLVKALGLDGYFSHVFSSANLGYEKPNPVIFARALKALGNPSTVWMVGDSYGADIVGALAAGISPVLVRSAHALAPRHCDSLLALQDLIGT